MNQMNTETEGLDGIIGRVESYIQNPDMVTPETLEALLDELYQLRDSQGGEEVEGAPGEESGMTGMINKMRSEQ